MFRSSSAIQIRLGPAKGMVVRSDNLYFNGVSSTQSMVKCGGGLYFKQRTGQVLIAP